jgi:hypothetical protein
VRPIAIVEADAPLEDIRVLGVIIERRSGPRDGERVAELGQEELVIRALAPRRTCSSGR